MHQKSSKSRSFWQELKRRKVVRVTTVYAATAFIVLQLVDIISQPLKLPEWTMTLLIILLCTGLIVTIILTWIYDITPSGIKKTKPVSTLRHMDQPKHVVPDGWKIATYISMAIIVGLVAFNLISRRNNSSNVSKLEKSIAVLPFKLLSNESDKQYLADGMMDAITLHLSRIKELRVLGRTSTEQYRNPTKTTSDIGKDLGVNFMLEGSFQKFGENVRLIVQLIKVGKEGHVWANQYDRNWGDIFNVQSEVAQKIASELNASITPEEKRLIAKVPTHNLPAYDLILKAQECFYKSLGVDTKYFEKVSQLAYLALDLDTGFAQAYYWIGASSLSDKIMYGYGRPFYNDTALYFFNKALQLDPALPEAYSARGIYYFEKGQMQKAINNFNNSIDLSPSNSVGYTYLGYVYWQMRDFLNAIINLKKAEKLEKGNNELAIIYVQIWWVYLSVGDWQKAEFYLNKIQKLGKMFPGMDEWRLEIRGKWEELLSLTGNKKIEALVALGRFHEAETLVTNNKVKLSDLYLNSAHRIGLVFWKNGKIDEAMKYFNFQISNCLNSIGGDNIYGINGAAYDLAGVYAVIGKKEEAYKWLREYEKRGFIIGTHEYIKVDVLFENLRNDEEFKQIVERANKKADELRVKINELEEQGIL